MNLNRGKRSVILDLKKPSDLETMRALLADADVFIHNVRGQAIERLGLDFEAVKRLKHDIIYVHCVGFGSSGPYADLQAYDDVIQAASGAASLASRVDGDPRPRYLPSLIADKVAGLHAAQATLAAIVHRLRGGGGQFVEVPMFETFTNFMLLEHLGGRTFEPPVGPTCYPRQIDPDRQPFPTADGYISIVAYTDEAWFRLFAVLGAREYLEAGHFATPALRFRNIGLLYREVARLTPSRTTADWVAAMREAAIPAMPVRDIEAILDDPHLRAVGFFERTEHPSEGSYYGLKSPLSFEKFISDPLSGAPVIGEHNDELTKNINA